MMELTQPILIAQKHWKHSPAIQPQVSFYLVSTGIARSFSDIQVVKLSH